MIITLAAGLAGGRSRSLILTAMIFAVAMTFIDQTIVSTAAPQSSTPWACPAAACSGRATPTLLQAEMVLSAAANRRRLPRSLDRGSTWCR